MRKWWERLAARERWMLGAGGLVLSMILIYFLVWEPWRNNLTHLRQQLVVQRQELVWMLDAAAELKRLTMTKSTVRSAASQNRSLSTLIDQTAKAAGLEGTLKRVEPQGEQRLRIRLEQVGFDKMLLWLSQLEQTYGVQIVSATVQREDSGRVSARLLLQEATL